MNNIIINSNNLTNNDINDINEINKLLMEKYNNWEVLLSKQSEFLQEEAGIVISILFVLQEIAISNAVYDCIKYFLSQLISKLQNTQKSKGTTIELSLNEKKDKIYFNFTLTENQKDKIVNAVIDKFKR